MAEKAFIKSLENFKGLDLKSSKLTGQQETGQLLTNLEYSEARGLRGRTGMIPIGQVGAFTETHTYNYYDSVTGATIQEMLAINDTLWRLKTSTLTVTGGANVNWQMTLNPAATAYRFVIQNNTTPYVLSGNNYVDMGLGTESENGNLLFTIEDLRAVIDANATLACALPSGIKFARVNGNQTNSVITVDAGHNYVVGDWFTCWDFATSKLVARRVSAIGATTITFDTSLFSTITVKDNQVFGPMASPATSIEIKDTTTQTTTIGFSYWDFIPYTTWLNYSTDNTPFRDSWASRSSANFKAPVFLNSNNCCYIYAGSNSQADIEYGGYPFKYDGQSVHREGCPPPLTAPKPTAGGAGALTGSYKWAVQYESHDSRGSINLSRVTKDASYTTLAALYQTLTFTMPLMYYRDLRYDAWNVSISVAAGPTNTFTHTGSNLLVGMTVGLIDTTANQFVVRQVTAITATTITFAGAPMTLGVRAAYRVFSVGFEMRGAMAAANAAPVTTLVVNNTTLSPNSVEVGDTIYLYDRTSSAYVERIITSKTATSLTWAVGAGITTNNNDPISVNLRATIYRNKSGGNTFYKVATIPIPIREATTAGYEFTYDDNTVDASLGYQLLEPPIGKEQDLPPKARFACNHQGTRCSAGDDDNPNTVYVYSTLDPESVPAASNSFDVQSQINGPIAAIASDDDDRLAIFKDHAYYQASGALDDNAFSVQTIREGDFGISSHRSLCKVNGALIGVGPLGVMGVKGGRLLPGFGEGIYPPLANNANVRLGQAVAINDYSSRHYTFFIPSTDMSSAGYSNSLTYSLDYINNGAWVDKAYSGTNPQYGMDAWFDRSYTRGYDIGGGMTMYNDVFHSLALGTGQYSEAGRIFKRLMPSSVLTTPSNLYWDVNQPISYVFEPDWLCPDQQISVDKEFLWFKFYCAPSSYELERFTSFTPTLTTYSNFNEATPLETITLPTLTTTVFEARKKLKSTKCRSILFKVSLNTGGACLYITGFEYIVSLSYIPEVPRTS